MSPEQMMSSDKVDVRADIWSLGVVLYELLGQRLPFQGNTMPELIASILQKTHEPIGAVRDDVPIGLANVIDTCLQKETSARYANIAELARALAPFGPARGEQSVERIEGVLGVKSISVQPPPLAGTDVAIAPMASATFSPTTSRASSPTSRVLVPVLLGFLLVAGVAGALLVRASRSPAVGPAAASVSVAAAPSATAALVAAPAASAPVPVPSAVTLVALPPSDPVGPGRPHGGPTTRPSASAPPAASTAAPAPPAPSCHVVSYFDADGNKHFRQECP
jgi:serine/threonine-protein kinase